MTEQKLIKFGDICNEVKLSTKSPIKDGFDKYIGLEHLESGSLKIKRWGNIADDKPSFTRVFKKGHILFGKRRPYLKKAAIAEFDGICSGDIIVMEPKSGLSKLELLPFIIQSDNFWSWAVKTSSGSLSPRTKFKSLAEYKLSLPVNFEGQEKLYSVLNKVWACVQAAEEVKDSCLLLAKVLSANCFSMSDKVVNHIKLKDLAGKKGLQTGPFGSQLHAEEYSQEGVPVLMPKNLGFGDFDTVKAAKIPKQVADRLSKHKLKTGDFIFGRRGDIGRFGYITKEFEGSICGTGCLRFRPNNKKHSDFLYAFFRSQSAVRWLNSNAVGMTMLNLNTGILGNLPVPDLNDGERLKIVTAFEVVETQMVLAKDHLATNKALMNAIINMD
jgi:type I restriction enzyme S subunit